MSNYLIGNSFGGSSNLEVSTAGQEIIATGKSAYKVKFYNQDACHVVINNTYTIYLDAYQGFESNEVDLFIHSFVITEANIKMNYVTYLK